jgi:hypothetical protein
MECGRDTESNVKKYYQRDNRIWGKQETGDRTREMRSKMQGKSLIIYNNQLNLVVIIIKAFK